MQEIVEPDIANVDLSNIAALQQKRTLAFVNHFVMTTVQFLNNFMKSCEQKMMHFERKLEKVNATMVLLEAKLSSIPEVNVSSQPKESQEISPQKLQPEKADVLTTETAAVEGAKEVEPQNEELQKVKPEYERFVKMVQVGVPLNAVKLKLSLEGLDPEELDRILKK
ncbi:WASH complex subunit 3 [Epargyreus clarus]|uniref:WASH complex subunit 3 n=1 Tax=Epargyreus clarus TaxID=520877 RepID=UPI003C2B57A9